MLEAVLCSVRSVKCSLLITFFERVVVGAHGEGQLVLVVLLRR